jgi:hypothetical protein
MTKISSSAKRRHLRLDLPDLLDLLGLLGLRLRRLPPRATRKRISSSLSAIENEDIFVGAEGDRKGRRAGGIIKCDRK